MTTTLRLILLVFFFCEQTLGTRIPRSISDDSLLTIAPVSGSGICKLMVESWGYECEEHTVTTTDGYFLSLQRIPIGLSGNETGDRPPVVLQHGVLMGYWDWSWDELAAYDLPAIVQYVYHLSGQKLHYVGHSQGTLIALAAFSQRRMSHMVRSAGLLSPIAYLSRMTSELARNAVENFVSEFLYWSGLHQFVPRGEAVMNLLKDICKKPGIDCDDLFTSFTGENCCLSKSTVPTFLEHEPQSTATKNMIHLAQMVRDGTIAMYDYEDKDKNIARYGQPNPPEYNLTNIPSNLPLFLAHGGRDALSDVDDVKFLLDSLKNHDVDKLSLQFIQDYAHADYVMAINAKELVYDPLIHFFRLHDDS